MKLSRKRKQPAVIRTSKYSDVVVITNSHSGFKIRLKKLSILVHAILKQLRLKRTSLSLVFVSDHVIKRLNRRYLNHFRVTDVLAFSFSTSSAEKQPFLGEVIISPMRAKVYAKQFKIPFEEELMRYVCHGILHLRGYLDHSVREKWVMRKAEDKLLKPLAHKLKGIFQSGH